MAKIVLAAFAEPKQVVYEHPAFRLVADNSGALVLTTTSTMTVFLDDAVEKRQLVRVVPAGTDWPIKQDASNKYLLVRDCLRVIELVSGDAHAYVFATAPEETAK